MRISIKYYVLCILLTTYYILHTTPVYADVTIGDRFGFGGIKSLGEATTNLVGPVFSLAAAAVVVYFLLGAFKYLRSDGNKEEVEGARQMITQAIVGFAILMFAFFILQFLLSSLFGITNLQIIK